MKRKILFSTCIILAICNTLTVKASDKDSTKVFEDGNKRIIVKENEYKQRVDVQVFELNDVQDTLFYEKIFEGHYRNGNSTERRRYLATIDIPMPSQKRWRSKHFEPHWAGFGIGFANFADKGDADDISIRSGKSLEYTLNFIERAIPISNHYRWAVVTGVGIRWTRYHIKGNNHFEEIDDYTYLVKAPEGIRYKRSKLGITHLSIPALLEWQNPKGNLFFSAGAVGSVKTWSSSRIEYYDEDGKKRKRKAGKGMTLRPLTVDFLAQAGTRNWGIYAKYSPISIFEHNKGPELYPYSIGIFWHLF